MLRRTSLTLLVIALSIYSSLAQNGSDIYLFNFKVDQDIFSVSNPQNITNTPGYDNQPSFTPDSQNILYSSDDGFGQTDIYRYSLKAKSERRLTFSPDSEYSPTVTPDKSRISCVILEKSGDQYLWSYPINGAVPKKVSNVNMIGYHSWMNDANLAVFLVEEPINTLATIQLPADQMDKLVTSPGRTLLMIPNTSLLSYADLSGVEPVIRSFNPQTKEIKEIITGFKGAQDFTWTPDGTLVSGDGQKLYKHKPGTDEGWVEMVDFADYGLNKFTRMTVSPNGQYLALVISE